MVLSQFLNALEQVKELRFQTPDGSLIPAHVHITEVGVIKKHFIDCGGTERKETVINFQLWSANDTEHRLFPKKVMNIIRLSQERIELHDHMIEVEYQSNTIGKYGLDFDGKYFLLTTKQTDCLAREDCGVPTTQTQSTSDCCDTSSDCC